MVIFAIGVVAGWEVGKRLLSHFRPRLTSIKNVAEADTTKIEQGVLTEMHRLVDAGKLDATRIEEYIVAHTLYLKALARKLVLQSSTTITAAATTAPVADPKPASPSV
jgi:hypothetical protein